MLTKTKITFIAALLLGSASGAFAMDPDGFDVDIFRPAATPFRPAATASVPSQPKHRDAFAQVPTHIAKRPTASATQSPSIGERNWMARASASFW